MLVIEEMRSGHKSPRRQSKDECLLGWARPRYKSVVCHPKAMFQEILLIRICIMKEQNKGKLWNI